MRFRRFIIVFVFSAVLAQPFFALGEDSKAVNTSHLYYDDRDFWEKFYVGGSLGLQFGTITVVDIAPQFGYRLTDRLVAGIGVTYVYYKNTNPNYYPMGSSNMYGGSLFTKFLIYNNIFAHAEFEALNLKIYEFDPFSYTGYRETRRWVPDFFIGGGYRQPLGTNAFAAFLLLYEVIQDRFSPYYGANPVIRISFGAGF